MHRYTTIFRYYKDVFVLIEMVGKYRRVSRVGPKGPPPPPLEIEKQKKDIKANFKLFHLYFATPL